MIPFGVLWAIFKFFRQPIARQSKTKIMNNLTSIVVGGGCFWCLEAIFQQVQGVSEVKSGYAGGEQETADYRTVCTGSTGHAEVVRVTFDPSVTSLEEILQIFFTTHDPTTLNRQGNDVGPQYRSAVFYADEEQRLAAEKTKSEYAPQVWDDPIVTEISPLPAFYPAEVEHDDYYQRVGNRNPYCTFVITPKMNKFRKAFAHKLQ